MKNLVLILFLFVCLIISCKKNEPGVDDLNNPIDTAKNSNLDSLPSVYEKNSADYIIKTGFNESYSSMAIADDGILMLGTRTYSSSSSIILLKSDFNRNILFSKLYYDSTGFDRGIKIIKTSDNNYLIAALKSTSLGFGKIGYYNEKQVMLLIKINKNGDQLWTRRYDFGDNDIIESLVENNKQEFIIINANSIFKIDSTGFIIWKKVHPKLFENQTTFFSLILYTSDNHYVIWANNDEALLLKLDENGDLMWSKSYENQINIYANQIKEIEDGKIIICGNKINFDATPVSSDGFIVIADKEGNMLNFKSSHNINFSNDITLIDNQQYILCGYTNNGIDKQGIIMLLDNNLTDIKRKNYYLGTNSFTLLWSIILHENDIFACGEAGFNIGNTQADNGYLVKLNINDLK